MCNVNWPTGSAMLLLSCHGTPHNHNPTCNVRLWILNARALLSSLIGFSPSRRLLPLRNVSAPALVVWLIPFVCFSVSSHLKYDIYLFSSWWFEFKIPEFWLPLPHAETANVSKAKRRKWRERSKRRRSRSICLLTKSSHHHQSLLHKDREGDNDREGDRRKRDLQSRSK